MGPATGWFPTSGGHRRPPRRATSRRQGGLGPPAIPREMGSRRDLLAHDVHTWRGVHGMARRGVRLHQPDRQCETRSSPARTPPPHTETPPPRWPRSSVRDPVYGAKFHADNGPPKIAAARSRHSDDGTRRGPTTTPPVHGQDIKKRPNTCSILTVSATTGRDVERAGHHRRTDHLR